MDRSIITQAHPRGPRLLLFLALGLLFSPSGYAGTDTGQADPKAEFAGIERDGQSLRDRQAALDKEFSRITAELDSWSKRNKVGVATPQLVLSLVSRSLEPHLGSDAHHDTSSRKQSAFEGEYAGLEHAMALAMHERGEIDRGRADLITRLARFQVKQTAKKTQNYRFGDVFMPIAGLAGVSARSACEVWVRDLAPGQWCVLVRESCEALDPTRPTEGWVQVCEYTCYTPLINTGPL